MPPDTQSATPSGSHGERKREHSHKERIGNYVVQNEIGRGSFATVYKGYRSKTRDPVAIKAVSRQKLTTKLLENLESEINILKAISHRNIVCLQDCFKNDTHIYLVMEYCTGSDLSIYIKNRGQLPTLDFVPRGNLQLSGVPSEDGKVFWPHPAAGGLDERVTRSFLGQLAMALQFLRSQDLIHRDIKPQNLLLQPPTSIELAEGHPLGIPILKVADFGFARILPAAAMAETLCGSPLYMAPEILRYEKYDAKADLWSVGAVLFEMAVGRPPFRASNHVELLKKIERGEDRIKFPDESSRVPEPPNPPPTPVSQDLKALIRHLLKRKPSDRMGFDDFFSCGAWDGYMTEGGISSSEGSMALDVSTSTDNDVPMAQIPRDSEERSVSDARIRAPQPISVDPALNPSPAPIPLGLDTRPPFAILPTPSSSRTPAPIAPPTRSEPKYYVGGDDPEPQLRASTSRSPTPGPTPLPPVSAPASRPISAVDRRRPSVRERDVGSMDDPPPLTPTGGAGMMRRPSRVGEGSPLAATPPMTMPVEDTGKDSSALESSDSVVNREYVVVEKQNVEINALADELDQASRANQALVRRPSSRTSVTTRPVSAFKPSPGAMTAIEKPGATSYSPPFGLSCTPPFAQPGRSPSAGISRPPSVPQLQNVFPPPSIPGFSPDAMRYGTSPSSLQTGAFARAITSTAIRLIGTGANSAATAIARATTKRRPVVLRSSSAEIDPAEEELIKHVEDIARKAFVLFELGDTRLHVWHSLVRPPGLGVGSAGTPPFGSGQSPRRKSSSSSFNSEVMALRQQQEAAGEATVLYCKALAFILQGTNACQKYWETKGGGHDASPELNELVQWLRARFNECYEKAEWVKTRAAEELPFVDRLVHDKARENAALAELSQDYSTAEAGYETSLWLLQALLDDVMYDGGHIRDDDRISIEKVMTPIKVRLTALRKKMSTDIKPEQ